jgi:hypothetical protein
MGFKRIIRIFFSISLVLLLIACNYDSVISPNDQALELTPEIVAEDSSEDFSDTNLNQSIETNPDRSSVEWEISLEILREPLSFSPARLSRELIRSKIPNYSPPFNLSYDGMLMFDNLGILSYIPVSSFDGSSTKVIYTFLDSREHLFFGEEVKSSILSYKNLYVITSHDRVLTYGDNSFGQLGNGNYQDSFDDLFDITELFDFNENERPLKIGIYDPNDMEISLGLLTDQGRMFLWGKLNFAINESEFFTNRPYEITSYFEDLNPLEILNDFHLAYESIFITNQQGLYGWGLGRLCGLGDLRDELNIPYHRNGLKPVKYSSVHPNINLIPSESIVSFGSNHIITSHNRILMWNLPSGILPSIESDWRCGTSTGLQPVDIMSLSSFDFNPNEYIIKVVESSQHGLSNNYYYTNQGRFFITGDSILRQPGPIQKIYTFDNPQLLDIEIHNDTPFWIEKRFGTFNMPLIVKYESNQIHFLNFTDDTLSDYEWYSIPFPSLVFLYVTNEEEIVDVLNYFGFDDSNYSIVSSESEISGISLIYKRN